MLKQIRADAHSVGCCNTHFSNASSVPQVYHSLANKNKMRNHYDKAVFDDQNPES
jgi:hypothetical protein